MIWYDPSRKICVPVCRFPEFCDPNGPKPSEHVSDLYDALSLTDRSSPNNTPVSDVEVGIRMFSRVASVIVVMLCVFGYGQRKSTSLSTTLLGISKLVTTFGYRSKHSPIQTRHGSLVWTLKSVSKGLD